MGLFQAGTTFNFYVDRDLVLDMAGVSAGASHSYDQPLQAENWPAHPDGPLMVTAHNRDIALQPDFLDRFFQSVPSEYKTLSMNQYVALSAYTGSSPWLARNGSLLFILMNRTATIS